MILLRVIPFYMSFERDPTKSISIDLDSEERE
jgi:hypothetical protein